MPSRYKHNNETIKPPDRRAREITQSYSQKFKKLDRLFAADIVGDGTGDIMGPFEQSQYRFWRRIWFGEINKDFDKIIQRLAREAASSDDGMKISPLIYTDRKGCAYPIMLQQFERAIGVPIVCGNAKHKLARLHYVRATAAEAAHTCRTNHGDKKWNPCQTGLASWFSQHVPEEYGTFEQFRNGYDFSVH